MKNCPQCKLENPSAAKYCMACGAIFVEENSKLEDVLLGKELDEVKETIELMKKLLTVLQRKVDSVGVDNAEIQQLKDQIGARDNTIKTMSYQIEAQKSEISNLTKQLEGERKKKKGGKWGWIFVLLSIGFAFFWYRDCFA